MPTPTADDMVADCSDAIIGRSLDGVVTAWNPGAEALFGYTAVEAIGRSLPVPPAECAQELTEIIARVAAGERAPHVESALIAKDGRRVEVSVTVSPIRARAGGGVIGISLVVRDIGLRMSSLVHQSLLLRKAQQVARLGFIEVEFPQGPGQPWRRLWSEETFRLLDVDPATPPSRELFMSRVLEEDRPIVEAIYAQIATGVKPSDFVFRVRTGSGELRFLECIAAQEVDAAGRPWRLFTTLQDITELKQAYDDLRRTQQAVMQQERLRALGQMASGIAHDINNAISPAALYTESMLEREQGLSARSRGYLESIKRAIEDVGHTVSRMREFYRHREPQLQLSAVDANEMVQQVVDLTRARWHDMPLQRGVEITASVELAAALPPIQGIPSEIREALINLVFNAVDAMPDGGTVTVRTRLEAGSPGDQSSWVRVEVADTGTGMDEETRKRCLEPFFTTKGDRGTGLGLAMVYGIVERHGAAIDIASSPGKGTTMSLRFPVVAVAAAAEAPPPSRIPTGLRLLVVDDDPILLTSLREILEADGHMVTAAGGGQAGLDALRAEPRGFDAVITDLGMPRVDGRAVAQGVKDRSPATPVIMLTGWGQRLIAEGEIPPGVDRVLNKPPKLGELRAALAQYCRKDGVVRA